MASRNRVDTHEARVLLRDVRRQVPVVNICGGVIWNAVRLATKRHCVESATNREDGVAAGIAAVLFADSQGRIGDGHNLSRDVIRYIRREVVRTMYLLTSRFRRTHVGTDVLNVPCAIPPDYGFTSGHHVGQ